MPPTATRRRRRVGLVFLGIALLLAIAGQTLLRQHLDGLVFLFYWLACLVALGLSVAIALLDLLLVRQEARREQLELLRQTLAPPRPNPRETAPQNQPPPGSTTNAP
jgi:hypothetical protein